jgi:peptidylprolyl isomerase
MKQKLPIFTLLAIAAAALIFFLLPGEQRVGEGETEPQPAASSSKLEIVEALVLDYENTLTLELSTGGPVLIQMFPDKAPNHVARFKELSRSGFYDGVVFHRVIEGFMAQTGDPTGTGSGGSGQNIDAEFNDIEHLRGIVSTARAQDPNSADSQFFFMLDNAAHLDGQYTAWGKVVEGMEYIDMVPKGPAQANGAVPEDQRGSIVSMQVMADVEDAGAGEEAGDE